MFTSEFYALGHLGTLQNGNSGYTTMFLLKDWLGTTREWADLGGNSFLSCQTFPYGEVSGIGCPGNPGWSELGGLWYDGEDNTINTPARNYSISQGRWLTPDPAGLAAVDPSNPQTWNRYAYVTNNPLSFVDPSGECSAVIGGITQTPNTPNVAGQSAFASSVGAVSGYPYSGGSKLGGIADVMSQGIFGGNQNTNVSIAAIMSAAQTPGPINIFAISGGAQSFATALQYLPADVVGRINNVTYIMPGSIGSTLPQGAGTTTLVDSPGLLNALIVGNVPFGANQISVNCGLNDHNPNCAFQQAQGQIRSLAGGPCNKTPTFTNGGSRAGSSPVPDNSPWQGWNGWSPFNEQWESVTHTISW
jgi:RHS repeat-associated protein